MLYNISISTNAGYIFGAEVLGGIGTGLIVDASFSVSQWLVALVKIPFAIGCIMCARVGGIALTLAMANMMSLNLSQNEIHRIIPAASKAEMQAAISGLGWRLLEVRAQISVAIVIALRKGFHGGHCSRGVSCGTGVLHEKGEGCFEGAAEVGRDWGTE